LPPGRRSRRGSLKYRNVKLAHNLKTTTTTTTPPSSSSSSPSSAPSAPSLPTFAAIASSGSLFHDSYSVEDRHLNEDMYTTTTTAATTITTTTTTPALEPLSTVFCGDISNNNNVEQLNGDVNRDTSGRRSSSVHSRRMSVNTGILVPQSPTIQSLYNKDGARKSVSFTQLHIASTSEQLSSNSNNNKNINNNNNNTNTDSLVSSNSPTHRTPRRQNSAPEKLSVLVRTQKEKTPTTSDCDDNTREILALLRTPLQNILYHVKTIRIISQQLSPEVMPLASNDEWKSSVRNITQTIPQLKMLNSSIQHINPLESGQFINLEVLRMLSKVLLNVAMFITRCRELENGNGEKFESEFSLMVESVRELVHFLSIC